MDLDWEGCFARSPYPAGWAALQNFKFFLRSLGQTTRVKICPKIAVSGFVDGKAHSIQTQVLGGVDRFDKASQANAGDLVVRIDGLRSPRALQFGVAGAFAAAGAVAAGGIWSLARTGAAVAGVAGLVGLYVALQGEDNLRQALKAPQWSGSQPVQLGAGPLPKSSPQPAEKLKELIAGNLRDFPASRQVVSLAGHGNHEQVGPLTYQDASAALQANPVEQVILDTCLGGQLEVLSRLAPWTRFVIASPQPIPALGLPFERMFAPDQLDKSPRDLASSWVEQARNITPSLAAWDCDKVCHELLPALDELGSCLAVEIKQGNRGEIRKTLRRSESPDWLSGRVDLGSFLQNLKTARLSQQTLRQAEKAHRAFSASLVQQQNEKTLTFHLARERTDETLPSGWRDFLTAADYRIKPGLFY